MVKIGFQASHEQFSPPDLLRFVQLAEQAGFQFVLSSDHVAPWSHVQNESGFALSWLGAAIQATSIPFSIVTVPGYRYHPVILAQAFATLCLLFPDRFFPCLGSGEALNEHVVGVEWPEKKIRNEILQQSVEVMRRLWRGETVSYQGHIKVDEAKLYSLPNKMPTIYGAALTDQTATWLGEWADGLATAMDEPENLKKRVQSFYQKAKGKKTCLLKAELSYDPDYQFALDQAYEQWRYTMVGPSQLGVLRTPEEFERESQAITKEDVEQKIKILTRPEEAISWIEQLIDTGFDIIILHNVNKRQESFIEAFGKKVLPYFNN